MKVLLIFPPLTNNRKLNITSVLPPLGISTIAAVLEECGHELRLLDINFLNSKKIYWEKVLAGSVNTFKPDIIGITCPTPAVVNVINIVKIIKTQDSNILIVVGGPHASVLPKGLLEMCADIDFVVIGEGEYTFKELISCIDNKKSLKDIQGIAYRDASGKIIITEKRPYIDNLDVIPLPARHLLPPLEEYYFVGHCYNKLPVTSMITSRGCPHYCSFCTQGVFGHHYRARSAESVVSEMEYLVRRYKIKTLMIMDDTFTADKERVYSICELIIKKNLDVSWLCYADIKDMNKDLLVEMKKAGCFQLYYGIESGTQRILDLMNKKITIEQIYSVIKDTKRAGLEVRGQFILGYPTETLKDIERTISFAKRLDIDYAEFGVLVPLPGSSVYNWAESEKKIKFNSNSDFDVFQEGTGIFMYPNSSFSALTREELEEYIKMAYRSFYLRFRYIFKRILRIRNFTDVRRNIEGFIGVTLGLFKFYKKKINRR